MVCKENLKKWIYIEFVKFVVVGVVVVVVEVVVFVVGIYDDVSWGIEKCLSK